jgi:hypothetical protein
MYESKGRKAARLFGAWAAFTKIDWTGHDPDIQNWVGLDPAEFDAEFAIGAAMTLEEAVEYGLSRE